MQIVSIFYLLTVTDGYMKFWEIRLPTEPVLLRMERSHWVWNIRINRFHDQLVLMSSNDSRVILYSIASISSEPFGVRRTFGKRRILWKKEIRRWSGRKIRGARKCVYAVE